MGQTVAEKIFNSHLSNLKDEELNNIIDRIYKKELDLYSAAESILKRQKKR